MVIGTNLIFDSNRKRTIIETKRSDRKIDTLIIFRSLNRLMFPSILYDKFNDIFYSKIAKVEGNLNLIAF